jgi:hypothetical protein
VALGLPDRFVLIGLCSGAYWSFHVAQDDARVRAVMLLNPLALIYDPHLRTVRSSRKTRQLARAETWQRIFRGEVTRRGASDVARAVARRALTAPARLPARAAARRRARAAGGDELDHGLDRLRENRVRTLLLFSAGEPLREELVREGRFQRLHRWPNVHLELLDGPPDTHKLQPLDLQERVHAILDAELERLLGRPVGHGGVAG